VFRGGKVHKVPSDETEALKSSLMGLFEKRRCAKFFLYAQEYKPDDPKTHQGYDLKKMTMAQLYAKFDLQPDTIDFIGHAICLYLNDDYLNQPAFDSVLRMQLYFNSLARYANAKSPYLYPLYGLGELPQGFARLSAIYGGTYMLNAPIDHVVIEGGKAIGVQSSEGDKPIAQCKFIVADPSYFPDRVHATGKVVRAICILNHPVPNTDNAESAQIIIPQKQVGRRSDIYVSIVSGANNVAPKGRWIATCAATVEHPEGDPIKELAPALALLGPIEEQFVYVTDILEPNDDGTESKIFISKSYDATSHFETTIDDVADMYRRITGKDLDLTPAKNKEDDETA
jgi:Rab GDP dissociation inhibitor